MRLRIISKGLYVGLDYVRIMTMYPGDILQLWLQKVSEQSNGRKDY